MRTPLQPDVNGRFDIKQPDSSGGPRQHVPSKETCPREPKRSGDEAPPAYPWLMPGVSTLAHRKKSKPRSRSATFLRKPCGKRMPTFVEAAPTLKGHRWGARKGGPHQRGPRPPPGGSAHLRKIAAGRYPDCGTEARQWRTLTAREDMRGQEH